MNSQTNTNLSLRTNRPDPLHVIWFDYPGMGRVDMSTPMSLLSHKDKIRRRMAQHGLKLEYIIFYDNLSRMLPHGVNESNVSIRFWSTYSILQHEVNHVSVTDMLREAFENSSSNNQETQAFRYASLVLGILATVPLCDDTKRYFVAHNYVPCDQEEYLATHIHMMMEHLSRVHLRYDISGYLGPFIACLAFAFFGDNGRDKFVTHDEFYETVVDHLEEVRPFDDDNYARIDEDRSILSEIGELDDETITNAINVWAGDRQYWSDNQEEVQLANMYLGGMTEE